MAEKNKKRDPMPPPDATPEEIGEFWDTHSLSDYWDETHEVEFQVNLKSRESVSPEEAETVEHGWQKLKELIQSMGRDGHDFEKLVATLLTSFLKVRFVVARSGDQPRGDARSLTGEVSIQAKKYSDKTAPRAVEIVGDIDRVRRNSQDLQVYVLTMSRGPDEQLLSELEDIEKDTGLDIVVLELTDELSDLGALCVTFWEDIRKFFDPSDTSQQFLDWVEIERGKLETKQKIEDLRPKLEDGIQTRHQVHKDIGKYLRKRFGYDTNHTSRFKYPIDLSKAIDRESLELQITNWWETPGKPVCYLEGEEGVGKSWLAAKWVKSICQDKKIVTFWLDSDTWKNCKSLNDLFEVSLKTIPGYDNERKLTKLKYKIRDLWWPPTLIVLDGVNEEDVIESTKQILDEYFTHGNELEGKIRIRLLLTTRPLNTYRNFQHNMWNYCERISVGPFNDLELSQALSQEGLPLLNTNNPLNDLVRIPRYFRIYVRLSKQFQSFNAVTREMIFWEDLLEKIKHTDPQVWRKFDWQSAEDAQEILARLAQEARWIDVDDTPQIPVEQFKKDFPNYAEIRQDLQEQRITLKAGKTEVELNEDHIVLGWALYLSKLFDCQEFTEIRNLSERFRQELEPIPEVNRRTDALFVALQITAIYPEDSSDYLSHKRAALMLAGFNSHNARGADKRLSLWAERDTDAYAQVVEFEFEHHNSPNYEDALITPLAETWLNKKGDLNRLASRLTKWLLPPNTDNLTENVDHINREGDPFPTMYYTRNRLLAAALSVLSQRPERQFLEKLAYCYANSTAKAQFEEDIGRLMRWGYTEEILVDLHRLAELAQSDELLLRGVYGLVEHLNLNKEHLPSLLQRPLSEKELETHALVEQRNRRFKPNIDRIRDQERLLIGDSPAANGNYHGLDYLAVRTDLHDLHHADIVEIKKILQDVSVNAELGWSAGTTREDVCIENLMPWVAKYDSKSYAELASSLKLNALNQQWAQFKLSSIQGLIFKSEDQIKITEAILEVKQRLVQDFQADSSSSDTIYLTSLLTETLLFSASEEKLTDWFNFLASHEPLRKSTCYKPLPYLLEKLLPESIVELARQKLEKLYSSPFDNQTGPNSEAKEFSEEDFWHWIYLCASDNDEDITTWALENLKRRKSDVHTITFYSIWKATLDTNRFLSEILIDKEMRKHLFLKDGRFFSTPIYEGENSYSYEDLVSVLPQEVVGSFLCSPKRRVDLSRWGKELMATMCSSFQGNNTNCNSVEDLRFTVNRKVLRIWAEQNTTDFLQLANEYFTLLSKSGWYCRGLYDFMDTILCLLLCFQPDKAMNYYHRLKTEGVRTIFFAYGGVETFFAQLWRVEDCNLPEHRHLRRTVLEKCLNDEEIMFMTLAALIEGGQEELWNLVTQEYLASPYAKERNLGVSILPWFGDDKAIEKLKELKSDDPSQWVRGHAWWAYEVAQQERSCREVYREALQTRDLFRISAAFEQIKPALSPTARWWHGEIEKKEGFHEESQDIDPRLDALHYRFWYRWGNSTETKRNIKVFGRKLQEYCRGEKLSSGSPPRIAPWWKPTSD